MDASSPFEFDGLGSIFTGGRVACVEVAIKLFSCAGRCIGRCCAVLAEYGMIFVGSAGFGAFMPVCLL